MYLCQKLLNKNILLTTKQARWEFFWYMKYQVWGLGTGVRLKIVFGNNLQLQAAVTYVCNDIANLKIF